MLFARYIIYIIYLFIEQQDRTLYHLVTELFRAANGYFSWQLLSLHDWRVSCTHLLMQCDCGSVSTVLWELVVSTAVHAGWKTWGQISKWLWDQAAMCLWLWFSVPALIGRLSVRSLFIVCVFFTLFIISIFYDFIPPFFNCFFLQLKNNSHLRNAILASEEKLSLSIQLLKRLIMVKIIDFWKFIKMMCIRRLRLEAWTCWVEILKCILSN